MLTAAEALTRLKDGNHRFVAGSPGNRDRIAPSRRNEVVGGQHPFAVVLGCADSRVPVETVFDQGLGDLFVVRVAGNIAAPSQLGSIEYAVTELGARLVIILGHTGCGAIAATIASLVRPGPSLSPNLEAIVSRVRPGIESLVAADPAMDSDALMREAIRANVRANVERLHRDSTVLRPLVEGGELTVVGAEYALESGVVEFYVDSD